VVGFPLGAPEGLGDEALAGPGKETLYMLDKPEIIHTEARQAAVIRLTIPRAEIHTVMGPGIGEVMAAVSAQGVGPAGPVFAHHLRMDPGTFDFELGVPVKAPFTAVGRVKPGQLPAAKVARTVYSGSYEGLGPAWGEFNAWLKANGHKPGPTLWECYVTGPESGPDPADWRTFTTLVEAQRIVTTRRGESWAEVAA
jgi:effector-binding domain-containing protein